MARAETLSERDRYRLIELLDTTISHYEFFLYKPPFEITDWSDDALLSGAIAEVHPCLNGWPSKSFFDFDYRLTKVTDSEYDFMSACDGQKTIAALIENSDLTLDDVRKLQTKQLIMLSLP